MAGEVRPPGDKSISHRCALFALMANGHSEITGISKGGDVNSTLGLVEALGGVVSEINGRDRLIAWRSDLTGQTQWPLQFPRKVQGNLPNRGAEHTRSSKNIKSS